MRGPGAQKLRKHAPPCCDREAFGGVGRTEGPEEATNILRNCRLKLKNRYPVHHKTVPFYL